MADFAISGQDSSQHRSKFVVRDYSGVVLQALIIALGAGIVWGLLRPGQDVIGAGGSHIAILPESLGASGDALMRYVLIIGVAGIVLGWDVFRRLVARRSLAMQVWVGVSALAAAVVFTLAGDVVAQLRMPDLSGLKELERATIVPAFHTYVAGLVMPFTAMTAYWFGLLIADGEPAFEKPA